MDKVASLLRQAAYEITSGALSSGLAGGAKALSKVTGAAGELAGKTPVLKHAIGAAALYGGLHAGAKALDVVRNPEKYKAQARYKYDVWKYKQKMKKKGIPVRIQNHPRPPSRPRGFDD